MTTLSLFLLFALTTVDVDIVSLPLDRAVEVTLMPAGKAEIRREGTLTRVKVEVDRLQAPASLGTALTTYLLWAVSPEGFLENLGELDINGNKGQLNATTRFGQLGLLITAEPHFMVDLPSSAVAYRSVGTRQEVRHMAVPVDVGMYDYSMLKPVWPAAGEAIRWSQRAVTVARTKNAERELAEVKQKLLELESQLKAARPNPQ